MVRVAVFPNDCLMRRFCRRVNAGETAGLRGSALDRKNNCEDLENHFKSLRGSKN